MPKVPTSTIEVPPYMLNGWQNIVDLISTLSNVPSALIMRAHAESIEVLIGNQSPLSPYKNGSCETLGSGLYCESVIETNAPLCIPNALKDPHWNKNPDIKLGMIAYYGVPINWPNGDSFGTICMLDRQENHFEPTFRELLKSFRISIESQLALLYQHAILHRSNKDLKLRVKSRTEDLANLNFSLCAEIEKRKEAEQKVAYQKTHDLGTGFINRNALIHETAPMFENIQHDQISIAFIHVGFTNGRRLQNKFGYDVFDNILCEYRNRVGPIKAKHSITARTSTIDLVIALELDPNETDIDQLCKNLVDISHSDFFVGDEPLHLHAFIGVATSLDSYTSDEMLKHAGEAMIACRDTGKKYAFYANTNVTSPSTNQLESYLLEAVRSNDLMLYFQPKVSPKSGKWLGAEALLRWNHPVLGQVSNDSLIQLAEQNGLIFEVGNYVLRTAIERASEWTQYVEDFKVAVNVSAMQLRDVHFVEQVEHLLETYHLPTRYLEIEVTESSLIADEFLAGNTLHALHQLGITLSLDDFGTGYSSFSYLKKYPFDCIKIDKSFIIQITRSSQDREIVRSIINVAKKLHLKVVMEGIETLEQEQFILDEGCDYGQGYLYGKPMNCQVFEQSLISRNYNGTS